MGGSGAVVDHDFSGPGGVVVGDAVFLDPVVFLVQEAVFLEGVEVRYGAAELRGELGAGPVFLGHFYGGEAVFVYVVPEVSFVSDDFFVGELVGGGEEDVDDAFHAVSRELAGAVIVVVGVHQDVDDVQVELEEVVVYGREGAVDDGVDGGVEGVPAVAGYAAQTAPEL